MVLTCVARLFPRLTSVALLCGSRITPANFAERMAALSITSIQLQASAGQYGVFRRASANSVVAPAGFEGISTHSMPAQSVVVLLLSMASAQPKCSANIGCWGLVQASSSSSSGFQGARLALCKLCWPCGPSSGKYDSSTCRVPVWVCGWSTWLDLLDSSDWGPSDHATHTVCLMLLLFAGVGGKVPVLVKPSSGCVAGGSGWDYRAARPADAEVGRSVRSGPASKQLHTDYRGKVISAGGASTYCD